LVILAAHEQSADTVIVDDLTTRHGQQLSSESLARLPQRALVAFACDCAEHVLPIFERGYPDDPRPREAIAAIRAWLRGEVQSAERLEQVRLGAQRASYRPHGSHSVTGNPGWMSGLTAIDATAAAQAVSVALATIMHGVPAALSAANEAAMAVAWASDTVTDLRNPAAFASQEERAWQEERLSALLRASQ
jgi:hypothetical protein